MGRAMTQLAEAPPHKKGGPGFDSLWGFLEISEFPNPSVHSIVLGSTQPFNRNKYQGTFLGVNCGRGVQLTTLL
jgi:hypothetical protein